MSECYPADALISFSTPALTKNCHDWTSWAMGEIKRGGFDLVVMSNRTLQPLVGVSRADQRQRAKEAYGRTLKALTSGDTPFLVIRDIPGMTGNVPDCIAAHDQDIHACTRPIKEAIPRDPAADAARANDSGLATVVDVNTLLCPRRVSQRHRRRDRVLRPRTPRQDVRPHARARDHRSDTQENQLTTDCRSIRMRMSWCGIRSRCPLRSRSTRG